MGRMNQTMTRLLKMKEDEYSSFVRVLFGLTNPSPVAEDLDKKGSRLDWIDLSLNESQKDAIRFALASREVALIHGPPGVRATSTTTITKTNKGNRLAKLIH
jgi:DNA polymerase alpha-associated DNA helicase A